MTLAATRSFDAVGKCPQYDHYFRANLRSTGTDAVHIFDYIVIGFLIVCMLTAAAKALALDKGRQSPLWPIRHRFKL